MAKKHEVVTVDFQRRTRMTAPPCDEDESRAESPAAPDGEPPARSRAPLPRKSRRADPRKRQCPACRMMTGIPILYGYPSPLGLERSERGEIRLGGCFGSLDSPTHECAQCGHRWLEDERP